jgi:hypothetical protein
MWSADLTPRERLLPPWLIGTLGALVGLALASMFPRERLEARLLEGGKVDALSVAYLEAWLRVRPNDGDFLSVLAAQYVRTGRLEDAEAMVARMRALHDKAVDREALLLDIAIREQRAYALQPNDPRRAAYLTELRSLLTQALDYRWSASELEILATKARGLDSGAVAAKFYQRLAKQDVAPPPPPTLPRRRRLPRWTNNAITSSPGSRHCSPATCSTRRWPRRSAASARSPTIRKPCASSPGWRWPATGPTWPTSTRAGCCTCRGSRRVRRASCWPLARSGMTGCLLAGPNRCHRQLTCCTWTVRRAWRVANAVPPAFGAWPTLPARRPHRPHRRPAPRPSRAASRHSTPRTTTLPTASSWAAAT